MSRTAHVKEMTSFRRGTVAALGMTLLFSVAACTPSANEPESTITIEPNVAGTPEPSATAEPEPTEPAVLGALDADSPLMETLTPRSRVEAPGPVQVWQQGKPAGSNRVIELHIDSVTPPLDGDEKAWVLEHGTNVYGAPLPADANVQKVTLRVREIASGIDERSQAEGIPPRDWHLSDQSDSSPVMFRDEAGERMALVQFLENPYGCTVPSLTPLAGTTDEVALCVYAVDVFEFPQLWLTRVEVRTDPTVPVADGHADTGYGPTVWIMTPAPPPDRHG